MTGALSRIEREAEAQRADLLRIGADGRWLAGVGAVRSAPEPLRRPTPAPRPYPIDALGQTLGPAARAMMRVIQAPDAVCGASVLAAASLSVQALGDVVMHGRRHPTSLWFLTVAESGERKSSCDTEATRPAREYERTLVEAHRIETATHRSLHEEWSMHRDAAKKAAKDAGGIGLAESLGQLGPPPAPPLIPKILVADFTPEGLFKLLDAGYPSIGALTDEGALVFGGHGMAKENIARTTGTLCKLWDCGGLDRVRSGDGAAQLYGRRFSIHLMTQPVIAESAFADDVLSGQGFLARCLIAWPQSTAGRRCYVAESLRDDHAIRVYGDRLATLHRQALPLRDGSLQELDPPAIGIASNAQDIWRRMHDAIELKMVPDGAFAQVRPWASKTAEQALRIAGVLALIDGANLITQDHMERAAELALWHLHEAARVAGTAAVSPTCRDAEALLAWAHDSKRELVCSSDALRNGPGRIRERQRFNDAMAELERAGWALRIEEGAVIDGKHRRRVWRIIRED